MPSPISPLNSYNAPPTPTLSTQTFHIAGIQTTVYGLSELVSDVSEVVCIWLLHPRLDSQKDMAEVAKRIVHDHYQRYSDDLTAGKKRTKRGMIAVSFDARNHGSREVDRLANEVWRTGNENHASDMFSVYSGTAQDVSTLIDFLPAYIFPTSQHSITAHFALGISLGGHTTWLTLVHEPRITTGIIIVGMPDYISLMTDRARLSKLSSWFQPSNEEPGSQFLGSRHFPSSLLEVVLKRDPAAFLMVSIPDDLPEEEYDVRAVGVINRYLGRKRILCLSGEDDKLVPYRFTESFMKWLMRHSISGSTAVMGGGKGPVKKADVYLEDTVYECTGHEFTEAMMSDALQFIHKSVLELDERNKAEMKSNL
ncbi:conserved hypothetical protein [Talaromyces stipitatus ATCC 10500]|uniref:AB hydrolase-1 domain-containing protein n=1 Tax=Talaromyces stipitatus (strain ATCC 10500 / CBS 375.48 / QM 6759 / NRRL 1006) TaxID=441959 RepID=B8MNP7_TALSN|nr:uncharacterized protein TSTA_103570 [Talaromyces stipitatus ATCC 10500]EED14136.1 conserved hypothetical protein [Talaromyces stipitatus ATCC 10500]